LFKPGRHLNIVQAHLLRLVGRLIRRGLVRHPDRFRSGGAPNKKTHAQQTNAAKSCRTLHSYERHYSQLATIVRGAPRLDPPEPNSRAGCCPKGFLPLRAMMRSLTFPPRLVPTELPEEGRGVYHLRVIRPHVRIRVKVRPGAPESHVRGLDRWELVPCTASLNGPSV
jgi:hypothetical protein